MKISRRQFAIGAGSVAFMGLAKNANALEVYGKQPMSIGYGDLRTDKNGLLDLPEGFSYRVISSLGDHMDDGLLVPDRADGMGCFKLDSDHVALVRNHELPSDRHDLGPFPAKQSSDILTFDKDDEGRPLPGGTSTIVYNMVTGERVREHMSLLGTIRNCSGGITPWGSWLTCEENVSRAGEMVGKDHGWVFEVPANETGLVDPVPLKALGRFNHEAAAIDPRTGIVYLTEDRNDSLFYRFLPNVNGDLSKGGRLQAMAFVEDTVSSDTRNWETVGFELGNWRNVRWIDLDNTDSPEDDLRLRGHADGAAIFARGEGIHWGDSELYFTCTSGGAAELGQIMRYVPSAHEGLAEEAQTPGKLQLFLESDDPKNFNYGDNLTVAPNGHLIVCEDQYTEVVDNHLRGVTPDGEVYPFARLRVQTEPAGACFSPDGATLFVNVYSPAMTLAITGPWDNLK
ncbi:alkaline phosphatase PhoX [Kordiimonas aquimaris]|uniref:alkaline phosphatase PhoX n=1 Tax=Kordiimonas aquimaris TaxID=707591 RepID=UPI0021D2F6F4|nr:alkaline phosphatase PhoX [Kordiimonas aquimaris]